MSGTGTSTFSVSMDGDKTGTKWHGEFTVKTLLSHRDELRRDQIRRELLGGVSPEHASVRSLNQADVFSDLAVRIVKSPAWWNEASGGLDLSDDNVIATIYSKTIDAEKEVLNRIKKDAEQANEELRKGEQP